MAERDYEPEKPAYGFVPLPDRPARASATGHDRYHSERLSGHLTLVYETLTPLHVGSGILERAVDCGLEGGTRAVRGMVRREGKPVLPGSSWKGAVRGRYEAITRSRLAICKPWDLIPANKLPDELREPENRQRHRVEVVDPRVEALEKLRVKGRKGSEPPVGLSKLSPAEALFGAEGYRGHVHPEDGVITGPPARHPLDVMPMETPALHRVAEPEACRPAVRRRGQPTVVITKVQGRKFYLDGPIVSSRSRGDGREASEPVDHVPAGAKITIAVELESVTPEELGALLLAAGYGDPVGALRFGGFKPAGLGKVRLEGLEGELWSDPELRSWKRLAGRPLEAGRAVESALMGLVDRAALDALHRVTTTERP